MYKIENIPNNNINNEKGAHIFVFTGTTCMGFYINYCFTTLI